MRDRPESLGGQKAGRSNALHWLRKESATASHGEAQNSNSALKCAPSLACETPPVACETPPGTEQRALEPRKPSGVTLCIGCAKRLQQHHTVRARTANQHCKLPPSAACETPPVPCETPPRDRPESLGGPEPRAEYRFALAAHRGCNSIARLGPDLQISIEICHKRGL